MSKNKCDCTCHECSCRPNEGESRASCEKTEPAVNVKYTFKADARVLAMHLGSLLSIVRDRNAGTQEKYPELRDETVGWLVKVDFAAVSLAPDNPKYNEVNGRSMPGGRSTPIRLCEILAVHVVDKGELNADV